MESLSNRPTTHLDTRYAAAEQYDTPHLRMVDGDPSQLVTIGGGLPTILKNAAALSRRTRAFNDAIIEAGLSTGKKPTAAELTKLASIAYGGQQKRNLRPPFKTGQGFNPRAFADRLSIPSKFVLDKFAAAADAFEEEHIPEKKPEQATWYPRLADPHARSLLASYVDPIDNAKSEQPDLNKALDLYKARRSGHKNAVLGGDQELADMHNKIARKVRKDIEEKGGDIDMTSEDDDTGDDGATLFQEYEMLEYCTFFCKALL